MRRALHVLALTGLLVVAGTVEVVDEPPPAPVTAPEGMGRMTVPWTYDGVDHDGCFVSPDGGIACPDGWHRVAPAYPPIAGVGSVKDAAGVWHPECVEYNALTDPFVICTDGWTNLQ